MDAYLSKPLQTSELLALLSTLFPGDAAEADMAATAHEKVTPVLDWDAALQRMAGDRELLQELINIFLAALPEQIAQIRNAVATRDAPRLHRAAHALKGTVSTFSAKHAFAAAEALERIGDDGDLSTADIALNTLEQELSHLQNALLSEDGEETT
jgi:HPt (histidine-containing phosphotransfer) domain-containing protein